MLLHTLLQLQWKGSCNTPNCFFMDPLNRLLNLLSYVINICRMCFVYLTFDRAQKVVCVCNIRWVGALGVPKIFEHIWNWKNSLPEERCLHTEQHHALRCLGQLLIQHMFLCMFSGQFSRQTHFYLTDIIWPVCSLILPNQTTAFGTMSKASTQNTNCKIGGLKHWVCSVLKGCIKMLCVVISFPPWT